MTSKCETDENGNKRWYNESGQLHLDENDLPAIEYTDGTKFWYQNGKCHRDNGLPACIFRSGAQYWDVNGTTIRYDNWIIG